MSNRLSSFSPLPGLFFVAGGKVAEAEKQRHGIRAATVTGLINDSTGDEVDLDAPARR